MAVYPGRVRCIPQEVPTVSGLHILSLYFIFYSLVYTRARRLGGESERDGEKKLCGSSEAAYDVAPGIASTATLGK